MIVPPPPLRTVIAGSRNVTDPGVVAAAIAACGWTPSVVISGAARGVDTLGEQWAAQRGVPVERYPADWNGLGKRAGIVRNEQMAGIADAVVAIWDGASPGTRHMIDYAKRIGRRVHVHMTGPTIQEMTDPASPHFDPPAFAIPAPPPPPARRLAACDIEVYRDYFLIKFCDAETKAFFDFESFPGQPLDVLGVVRALQRFTIITFNGRRFDVPMLTAALAGYDNAALKHVCDSIIQRNMQPWEIEREFNLNIPYDLDHIDLFDVTPGKASLKIYGGRLHSRRMQDLPIEPGASIAPEDRALLRDYCGNDLLTTLDLYRKFEKVITLRAAMSKEYGIDLRSKSDAQIAEAVIKHEIGFAVVRPVVPVGTQFVYKKPDFIQFQTQPLRDALALIDRSPFAIEEGISKKTGEKTELLKMSDELAAAKIAIGKAVYKIGSGGLHSTESQACHVAGSDYVLSDHDVASYYPYIILNLGLYPPQMGPAFLTVYKSIVDRRIAAKRAGDKKTADMLKIVINGSFGKLGSKYSALYAPDLLVQVTVTGQLALLMLIEMFELSGIAVVSANTDGIVVKTPRGQLWLRDSIIAWWEKATGFETEAAEYKALFSRDVNNYIAFKPDGEAKLKGAYAPPEPVAGSWPNPANEISVNAVVAYLRDGTPIESTVRACTDIKQFVTIRTVKGGAVKYRSGSEIVPAKTVGGKREQLAAAGYVEVFKGMWAKGRDASLPLDQAHRQAVAELRNGSSIEKDFLGKAIRWYYAAGEMGAINYALNGNRVPKTEGARPLMELPDALPDDIDYAWYIREAHSILSDMGTLR